MNDLTKSDKKTLNRYKDEYKDFLIYLQDDFFEVEYIDFYNTYNIEENIDVEIQFGLYIQNKINYILCDEIRSGNIDLEIQLIDKYMPIINLLINKLKISDESIDKEGILIKSFENYDGSKLLSIHILNVLKTRNENITFNESLNVEEKLPDNCQLSSNNQIDDFSVFVENYITSSDPINNDLTEVEDLFIKFNCISLIEDEALKRYASLRFGYYNFYFTDEDIMKLLNLSISELQIMYKMCLKLLKTSLNEKIDYVIMYLQSSNQKTLNL